MTTLEKFFLGFAFVIDIVSIFAIPREMVGFPVITGGALFFFIAMRISRSWTFNRALAKGVVRVYRESSPSFEFRVEREPVFPYTRKDYGVYEGALEHTF